MLKMPITLYAMSSLRVIWRIDAHDMRLAVQKVDSRFLFRSKLCVDICDFGKQIHKIPFVVDRDPIPREDSPYLWGKQLLQRPAPSKPATGPQVT